MFRAVINNTQMTSDAANNFFQNIRGESFNGDNSFLATLRTLVAPRMQEGESIYLRFSSSSYSATDIGRASVRNAVQAILNTDAMESGEIRVHNFTHSSQESNFANLELMKSSFTQVYPEWHCLEKVTDFFRKTFYVLCFINADKRQVAIFTDSMDIRKMHYLQCSIFAFMPWYFDPQKGVSQEEMELIQSLRERSSVHFEECIEKAAKKYDFHTARIRQLLSGFETRYERMEYQRCVDSISTVDRDIETYYNYIAEQMRTRRDLEIRLNGLQTKLASGSEESEIMDYFLSNKKLVLESVTESKMTFSAYDYLTYFDEELAKKAINNDRSFVYLPSGRACNQYIPHDDMKLLMTAIFIDQTLRIKFCAAYSFDIGRLSVSALSRHNYGAEFRDCMPNTHIDQHSCLGTYHSEINKALQNNDYVFAIEQCVASCKSLNFGDGIVMGEFMSCLYGLRGFETKNNRCIELPDGCIVTPKEAIEYLKLQEVNADE